eukprot:jgi/Undpi1/4525/HiC_scaffold_18.g07879.m1
MFLAFSAAGAATGEGQWMKLQRISRWHRLHAKANAVVDNFFYHLGHWVASHPKATLLISLVFVLVCCWGFKNFEEENNVNELWVPSDNLSKRQAITVVTAFGQYGDYAVMLMESPSGRDSVLTKESIDAVWELDEKVLAIGVEGNRYADLCTADLDGVTCKQPFRGITRFWGNSLDMYEASVSTDEDVLAAVNAERFPDGQEVTLEAIFGNSITFDRFGNVTGARAMMQSYELHVDLLSPANADISDWQAEFQELMGEEASKSDVFNIKYFTGRSISDALNESLSGELFLFVITYIIMITFVMIALGRCCSGHVRCRSWLGLGGVMTVVAAGLAAYGFQSGLGVPFTMLAKVLPFILIGIGVDDMFVILAAFDHTDPNLPVEERVGLGLKRCGVSVTYTSLTNFFAFMLGTTSSLPVVEYFCLYAGTAILFDFFLQMTAFVAFLTMDANRQKASRMDWWCCFCKSHPHLEERERVRREVSLPHDKRISGDERWRENSVPKHTIHELGSIGRFIKGTYTPFILSAKGKTFVLVGAAALLAAGIYGVMQATQGFDVLDLAPDDHFARDYTELARVYELEVDTQYVELGIVTEEVDYRDIDVQAQMQATDALMEEQTHSTGPTKAWITSFVKWAANNTEYRSNVGTLGDYYVYEDRDTFYTALANFTADGENGRFVSDIIYNDDGRIQISRSRLYLIDLVDTVSNIDALQDTREVVGESTLYPRPFGHAEIFVFTEQFLVMYEELILNFALALAAVGVLSTFILGKVAVVALVCLTVVIIDVELLGFVYHWGLEVNSITVIELIMAVGLVVDYMVHVVHYFLHQNPNTPKDERIADTLGEIGPSVMVGAATTFLGIMPLAFANNVIFRVFFKMFLVIICFGSETHDDKRSQQTCAAVSERNNELCQVRLMLWLMEMGLALYQRS